MAIGDFLKQAFTGNIRNEQGAIDFNKFANVYGQLGAALSGDPQSTTAKVGTLADRLAASKRAADIRAQQQRKRQSLLQALGGFGRQQPGAPPAAVVGGTTSTGASTTGVPAAPSQMEDLSQLTPPGQPGPTSMAFKRGPDGKTTFTTTGDIQEAISQLAQPSGDMAFLDPQLQQQLVAGEPGLGEVGGALSAAQAIKQLTAPPATQQMINIPGVGEVPVQQAAPLIQALTAAGKAPSEIAATEALGGQRRAAAFETQEQARRLQRRREAENFVARQPGGWKSGLITDEQRALADPKRFLTELEANLQKEKTPLTDDIKMEKHELAVTGAVEGLRDIINSGKATTDQIESYNKFSRGNELIFTEEDLGEGIFNLAGDVNIMRVPTPIFNGRQVNAREFVEIAKKKFPDKPLNEAIKSWAEKVKKNQPDNVKFLREQPSI